MSRPAVKHDGFLIPNASGVAEPVLAEPDQIDFNTLANTRWGVIEGCEVNSQSAKSVAVSPGTAIVNNKLVTVAGGGINLPTPGANSQFVLVVVDAGGQIKLNSDALSSVDPVFPDPKPDETVLASVLCDSTAGSFANFIVDKRKLLSTALLTKISPTAELVRNVNGTGNHYLVTGEGRTTWETDTKMYRASPGTLKIEDDLIVANDLQVTADITASTVTATGKVLGSNLRQGTVLPLTASDGDLFVQTSTGNMYIWINGEWNQFASMSATQGVVPVGTVIFSLQPAATIRDLGWFPMDGVEVLTEVDHPKIFNIDTGGAVTGTAPNRSMTLPNLNRRVIQVDFASPHQNTGLHTNNIVALKTENIPKHNHSVGGTTIPGRTSSTGKHTPVASITAGTGAHSNHAVSGGYHDHPVYDTGHAHNGMDWYGVSAAVIGWVGFNGTPKDGKNKIDALFNDSSHTYTVEPIRWTMPATTGINIGINHTHGHGITGGGHDHAVSCSEVPDHYHTVTELDVGSGQAIDFTPWSFTTYAYIRA